MVMFKNYCVRYINWKQRKKITEPHSNKLNMELQCKKKELNFQCKDNNNNKWKPVKKRTHFVSPHHVSFG